MSVITDIADAIVADLNAHVFTPTFTSERKYDPGFRLEDVGSILKVLVVPAKHESVIDSRESTQNEYAIDIGVIQNPATRANAAYDTLMDLVHLAKSSGEVIKDRSQHNGSHRPL